MSKKNKSAHTTKEENAVPVAEAITELLNYMESRAEVRQLADLKRREDCVSAKKTSVIAPQPKYVMPIIPDEILDNLINRYSLPVTKIPKDDETVMLWKHTEELKGWLSKKTHNEHSFAHVCWTKIRKILDAAVEDNNISVFEEFSKAWNSWDIASPLPKKAILKGKEEKKEMRFADKERDEKEEKEKEKKAALIKAAPIISNLSPLPSSNTAHSPRKLDLIFAIQDIQRRKNRAPTREEIAERIYELYIKREGRKPISSTDKPIDRADIGKNKVSEWAKEMGLNELLSRLRRPK